MERNEISIGRFGSPSILTENTVVLGIPVKTWNKAFMGNLDKTLIEVEQRVGVLRRTIHDTPYQTLE